MKRIILIIAMTAAAVIASGGSLSAQAEVIREKMPETYQAIKDRATEEWGSDAAMIVWEINLQTAAMFSVMNNETLDDRVFEASILEWADPGYIGHASDAYAMGRVDWAMVEFECNRQMAALSVLD